MEWDRDVTEALERMSIYLRARLRARLLQHVDSEGRERVTGEDLRAVRSMGMGGMRAATPEPLPEHPWPPLAGHYDVLEESAPVAVCTLASEGLVEALGRPRGVAIIGRAFTENLGAEKVAINVVANPYIRVLVLCGTESQHSVGQTLQALHANGLDADGRVVGSEGPLPILKNFPAEAQTLFREKLAIVDLIDETDPGAVLSAVEEASSAAPEPWSEAWQPPLPEQLASSPAPPPMSRPEDPAGFLLLSVGPYRDRIVLEHYSNDAQLLHVLHGRSADDVCGQALRAGALSELAHATYVGREALKAELALRHGLAYEQDRALELQSNARPAG